LLYFSALVIAATLLTNLPNDTNKSSVFVEEKKTTKTCIGIGSAV